MSAPFVFSDTVNLLVALVLGVFYLTDFAVPKAMFTAILVAATGLCVLSDLKVLDMSKVWIIPTFFWPQLVGGALFGLGYLVSGYCPGTAVAGLASGRLDALVTMIGIGIGTLLFSVLFPLLEGFYKITDMGQPTLPVLLGINHWAVLAIVFVLAVAMFYAMEWYEKRKVSRAPKKILHPAV